MATLINTNSAVWQDIQATYERICSLAEFLDTHLKTPLEPFFDDLIWKALGEDVQRIANDTKNIIDILNKTPTFDRKAEANRPVVKLFQATAETVVLPTTLSNDRFPPKEIEDVSNETPTFDRKAEANRPVVKPFDATTENVVTPTPLSNGRFPPKEIENALVELRQKYTHLVDLHLKVISPQERPKQLVPPWMRYVSLVAASLLAVYVVFQIILSFFYNRGLDAYNQQAYIDAISPFTITHFFSFQDSANYLANSYRRAIDQTLSEDTPDFEQARSVALNFFNARLDDNQSVNSFHRVYFAEAEALHELIPDEMRPDTGVIRTDVTPEEADIVWNPVAAPLLALRTLLLDTIAPALARNDQNQLSTGLALFPPELTLLEQSYVARALARQNIEQWQAAREITSETNLPYPWTTFRLTRYVYLDNFQYEIEALSTQSAPDWALIEGYAIELIGLLDQTDSIDNVRYLPTRTLLASRYVEQSIAARPPLDNGGFEQEGWESVRDLLAQAKDVLHSEMIDNLSSPGGQRVSVEVDYRSIEVYQERRLELLNLYAATPPSSRPTVAFAMAELLLNFIDGYTLDTYYEPAQAALAANRLDAAVILLRQIYQLDPEFKDSRSLLIETLRKLGEFAIAEQRYIDAEMFLEELKGIEPDDFSLQQNLSIAYYDLSRRTLDDTTNPNRFEDARTRLLKLYQINPEYRDTAVLIRETFYQPVALAIEPLRNAPNGPACADIRVNQIDPLLQPDVQRFDEISRQLLQDPPFLDYGDMRLLRNETFYCEARTSLTDALAETNPDTREAALEAARLSIEALGINSNYRDINNLIIQSFYLPAIENFRTAYLEPDIPKDVRAESVEKTRALLGRLRANTQLFFITYADSQILLHSTYYIPAFQQFEAARREYSTWGDNLNTQMEWEEARTLLQELIALDPAFSPSPTFQVAGSTITIGELLGANTLPAADVLYNETYYAPALGAFQQQDWVRTRSYLDPLLVAAPSYRDARVLHLNSYYTPGRAAVDAGDWAAARENLLPLLRLDPDYRSTIDAPSTFTLLSDSYAIPISRDYPTALQDYASAFWEPLLADLSTLVTFAPDYITHLPMAASAMLRDAYYQRSVLAEAGAQAAQRDSEAEVLAWQITLDSLESLLLLDADPAVAEPNLLSDILAPYRDAQDRLRGVYHSLARSALAVRQWERARTAAQGLLFIDPEDELANMQVREASYEGGQEALQAGEFETARVWLTQVLLLDGDGISLNPFDTTQPFRDADQLLLLAYHNDGAVRLEAQDWEGTRRVSRELLALQPVDDTANVQLREAYYREAQQQISRESMSTARQTLETLLLLDAPAKTPNVNLLLDIPTPYSDAQTLYRETYLIPARENLAAGEYSQSRRIVAPLLLLDASDPGANDIVILSYLRPAEQFVNTGNWGLARDTFQALFDDPISVRLANGTEYVTAVRLYMTSYLQPAQDLNEVNLYDWANIRQNAGTAIAIGLRFIGEDTTPIDDLLTQAKDVVNGAFLTPVNDAIREQDWQSARGILDEFSQTLSEISEAERAWYLSQEEFDQFLVDTYAGPVVAALANGDLAGVQAALNELETSLSNTDVISNELRINVYSQSLDTALERNDLSSAVELYNRLSEQAVSPSVIDGYIIDYPALRLRVQTSDALRWESASLTVSTVALDDSLMMSADVTTVATNPSGTRLYVGDGAGRLAVIGFGANTSQLVIDTGTAFIGQIAVDPYGRWVATAHEDNLVRIWNPETGQMMASLQDHPIRVIALGSSRDGALLASSDEAGAVLLWSTDTWTSTRVEIGSDQPAQSIAFSPSADTIVLAVEDELVSYDPTVATVTARVSAGAFIDDVIFAPDGQTFLVTNFQSETSLWSSALERLRNLTRHNGWVRAGVFSPLGDYLLALDSENQLSVWNPSTGTLLRQEATLLMTNTTQVVFMGQGSMVVAVGRGHELQLINNR